MADEEVLTSDDLRRFVEFNPDFQTLVLKLYRIRQMVSPIVDSIIQEGMQTVTEKTRDAKAAPVIVAVVASTGKATKAAPDPSKTERVSKKVRDLNTRLAKRVTEQELSDPEVLREMEILHAKVCRKVDELSGKERRSSGNRSPAGSAGRRTSQERKPTGGGSEGRGGALSKKKRQVSQEACDDTSCDVKI